ncbi:MAG: hypothetical protein ACLPXB_15755 [Thiobacillaceae bacterium]
MAIAYQRTALDLREEVVQEGSNLFQFGFIAYKALRTIGSGVAIWFSSGLTTLAQTGTPVLASW